ncbi:hypothetical protein A3J90_02505 [candidate division WOR-1 bacterium RIFOXYC2_FULL_37_10]|uniref:SMP-30/Gluconolactonase/LRE-like region domain-containing protein n=1 Tax=candidate division WOR-1 bacterium RIFOXYB2_FULL_37_13 TaxID=1802579 RepID=A0A1F4SUR1_UNCSA|nr:MAG: hypothetical protein A2310_05105 [candidate division WOR-1 bacterium RIFOXYB2_FULL_37_13]OGC32728.1 MAG: hypothetical protein A3J90_02505 [candidate division WOR-1 bacterium RIFOXYC2_FULL_37_10]
MHLKIRLTCFLFLTFLISLCYGEPLNCYWVSNDNDNLYVLSGDKILSFSREGVFNKVINRRIFDFEIGDVGEYIFIGRFRFKGFNKEDYSFQTIEARYKYQKGNVRYGFKEGESPIVSFEAIKPTFQEIVNYLKVEPTIKAIIENTVYPKAIAVNSEGNFCALGRNIFLENDILALLDKNDGHPVWVRKIARFEGVRTNLRNPMGIAVDSEDNIYITNPGSYCVHKYDKRGNLIAMWGKVGRGDGEFKASWAIAVDKSNNDVYVTDNLYDAGFAGTFLREPPQIRVQKFDSKGNFLLKWGRTFIAGFDIFPPALHHDTDLHDLESIAINNKGFVYVLETQKDCIVKFDGNGRFIMRFGMRGNGTGQLASPQSLSIDIENNIYVADSDNNKIVKFDENGKFLMEIKYNEELNQ